MKKALIWIVMIGLVIWGLSAVSGSKTEISSKETGPIKIGVIAPLTGDGAAFGEPMLNVYQIAVDEINKTGGVNGRQIELIAEDGKCTGTNSASAASKLINIDKVQVILGGFCSSESLSALAVAEISKVAIISGGSSSPDLTGRSKFFSRTYPSDASQGSVLAQIAFDQGVRKVSVIQEQLDYPLGIYKAFESRFISLGGQVTKEEYQSSTSDFKSMIAKAKASTPDALFIIPQTPASAEKIATQLQDSGWKPKMIVGDIVITTPELLSKYKIFEGAIGATFGVDESNQKYIALLAAYKSKFNKDLPYPGYAQTVYDSVFLVKDAISEVGNNGQKIASWLQNVSNWQGASGLVTIGADGDRVGGHQSKVVKNGKAEIMK